MLKETLNKMGYQAETVDAFSRRFIQYVGMEEKPCLEVGCAFGRVAKEIMSAGVHLYCNDLDQRHLDIIESELAQRYLPYFHPLPGDIRCVHLEEGMLSAVLCNRVIHFFSGNDCIELLKKMYQWLTPGGKLFLTAETPFLGSWTKYQKTYAIKKREKQPWPGYITDPAKYESSGRSSQLPSQMHFFDIDTMVQLMHASNFSIEEIFYIDRKHFFPEDLLLDGRESLAVLATKW